MDKHDHYYLYKIRNGLMFNETDYIFKSSQVAAQVALDMDVNGPTNLLQMKNVYFDTAHSRVHGFLTIWLWVVHPALGKIINLASMEIWSENSDDVATFFTLFNLVLCEVSGDMTKLFNPWCFVCDESGANYNGICLMFGMMLQTTGSKDVSGISRMMSRGKQMNYLHIFGIFSKTCAMTVARQLQLSGTIEYIINFWICRIVAPNESLYEVLAFEKEPCFPLILGRWNSFCQLI